MIYCLFILLIGTTILNYVIYRNILMPSFLICASFLISAFVFVVYSGVITDDIMMETVLVIILSIFCFMAGEMAAKGISGKEPLCYLDRCPKEEEGRMLHISMPMVGALTALILVISYMRFQALCKVAGAPVSMAGFFSSYAQMRFHMIHGVSLGMPAIADILSIVMYCAVRICITVFSYNAMKYHKICVRYLFAAFAYFLYLLTTTTRTGYMDLIAYTIFQYFFLVMLISKKRIKINGDILKIIGAGTLTFGILFAAVGNMAEKGGSVMRILFGYTGASFIGLDQYLEKPYYAEGILHSRTIQGLFTPFDRFGLDLPEIAAFLPHYYYGKAGENSNEYTSLMEPIYDFGIGGMLISRIILGMVFYFLYNWIIKNGAKKQNYCWIPMFVPAYYALIMSSIDDQFSTYIGMYYIYQLIFTWVLWKVCVKRLKC